MARSLEYFDYWCKLLQELSGNGEDKSHGAALQHHHLHVGYCALVPCRIAQKNYLLHILAFEVIAVCSSLIVRLVWGAPPMPYPEARFSGHTWLTYGHG